MVLSINKKVLDSILTFRNKTLFVDYTQALEVTYESFGQKVCKVMGVLEAYEIAEGEVVALIANNSVDHIVWTYGVMLYGAVVMPLNPKLSQTEISYLTEHANPRLIVNDGSEHKSLASIYIKEYENEEYSSSNYLNRILNSNGDEHGGLLIYTSGTTGKPKGVFLNLSNIYHNTMTAIESFNYNKEHTTLCLLPLFHTFGFISDVSTMLFAGGSSVIMDVFDASAVSNITKAIKTYDVNSFSAVPLIFELLIKLKCNLKQTSMKFCIAGAAPLSKSTSERFFEAFQFEIIPAYGLTETTCFCLITPMHDIRYGSAGKAANIAIKVISEHDHELPANEIGEIIVQGPSVITEGYFKDDRECYSVNYPGWFKTGDLGYYDDENYFYITGRKKNMVIKGGEKIYLEDVDKFISTVSGVKDNASIRVEDTLIDKIACFIVRENEDTLDEHDLKKYIVEHLGKLKCPDLIFFVEEIPRTATNKVRIAQLQDEIRSKATL